MTKRDIDNYINRNYDKLVIYAKKMYIQRNKVDESEYAIISGLYEYLLSNISKLKNEDDIKNFSSTFIYNNTYWTNGFTEKEPGRRRHKMDDIDVLDYDKYYVDEFDYCTEIDDRLAFIEFYYTLLKTPEERAVWEIYFIEEKQTGREFGEYIKLSTTVGGRYIKWLREDIKEKYEIYKKQIVENPILPFNYNINNEIQYNKEPDKILNKKLNKICQEN